MQLTKLTEFAQNKDKVLTSVDGKMIFKINKDFFIDYKGVKSFAKTTIEQIVPLNFHQGEWFAKKYIKKCTRSETGTNSYEFIEDIYHFLLENGYEEEDCIVSNEGFLIACYLSDVPVKIIENGNDISTEVFLNKAPKEYHIKTPVTKTFFGLEIQEGNLIKESDIKKLPFYKFWKESARGSTYAIIDNEDYVYLNDFESFSKLFIETGKHRFQKRD